MATNMHLDTELRLQLRALRGEWPGIAKHADVSLSWMSQFARGLIPNPGIQTLRQLAVAIETLGLAKRAAKRMAASRREPLTRRSETSEEAGPQYVLKAEAATPDATDRDAPAMTSPGGGPMGAGQPAAAGPSGDK